MPLWAGLPVVKPTFYRKSYKIDSPENALCLGTVFVRESPGAALNDIMLQIFI